MNFDLAFYRAQVMRRLPVMTLFVLLFSGLGIVTALKLPETYSTSARLLIEASQIPNSMIASTIQTGAAEQLAIIEQRLLTRANLIDIANRFDVFTDIREIEPDRVLQRMREGSRIRRVTGGGAGATMMTISFEARDPQIAANVVNEYVTLVLQENSRFRVSRAEGTLEFFQQEVDRLNEEMTRKTVEITRFKSENAGALPQDRGFYLQRQSLLQERLERLSRDLALTQRQREAVELRFETAPQSAVPERSPLEQDLLSSKAELERLSQTYNASNPRIIRLRERISRLETVVSARNASRDPVDEERVVSNEQLRRDAVLEELDVRIDALEAQIDSTASELEVLAQSISESTANSFRLDELERDLEIVQARYNSAVTNLNSASMSQRVELTAQGQRINVIENASVPQIPSGPDRLMIGGIGVFLGIALAVGYFALLEFLNRNIRRPAELSDRFSVTPIATIPYMESRFARLFRRSALVMATIGVLIGVPLGLWYVDTNYIPLELLVQRGLVELGLG